jgi:hypothetical protein
MDMEHTTQTIKNIDTIHMINKPFKTHSKQYQHRKYNTHKTFKTKQTWMNTHTHINTHRHNHKLK